MINFDEELKKFYPSQEIDDFADAIYNQDYTDLVDILIKAAEEVSKEKTRE